jgi:hypothetical protein
VSGPITEAEIGFGGKGDAHPFRRIAEGHYRLDLPECATTFEVVRFYRDHNDLCAELIVTSRLKGARTFQGALFSGSINLSNAYRRRDVVQQPCPRHVRTMTPPL